MNRSLIVLMPLIMLGWVMAIPERCSATDGEAKELSDARAAFFESHIRPALIKHCLACHSNETEVNGGLLLDSLAGWKKGGDSGKAIEPAIQQPACW